MDDRQRLLARLARPAETRMVLLVLDGVGDVRSPGQPQTALEKAATPCLDELAARGALGRMMPMTPWLTPGSGPGHLALFGYDPARPEVDIGRGILEALGSGVEVARGEVAARGNFATADADGRLTDRRAGRIPTEECRRLVSALSEALAADPVPGLEVRLQAGEGHRFVLVLGGEGISPEIRDTDPQRLGVPPLAPRARQPEAAATAARIATLIERLDRALADEPRANRILLRGFSRLPDLPGFTELYKLRAGAFAGYPLYRGVAAACGMEVVPCGKTMREVVEALAGAWDRFDLFFAHIKQTDAAGEDGNLDAKAAVIEEVDRALPDLLALGPDVVAITADHSTPAPMASHSWHPVPLLLWSERCFVDDCRRFDEVAALDGHLGTFPASDLIGLMLANAGRLAKYGA